MSTAESVDQVDAESFDAILIATPAATHYELASTYMDRGYHVFVEKPLAMRVDESEALAAQAEANNLTCMVGHTFLYSGPVNWLRDYVHSGNLGKIHYIAMERLNLGRVRSDCDVLWNLGPHDISILVHLLGLPESASAVSHSFLQPDIADVISCSLRFPDAMGFIRLSWLEPQKVRRTTVVGSKQMVVYDDVSSTAPIAIYDAGVVRPEQSSPLAFSSYGEFGFQTRQGDIAIPMVQRPEPLISEMNAFADAVATGVPPASDARHGVAVTKVLTALTSSASNRGAEVAIQ